MLRSLITSKTTRKLLTVFLTHPDEKFYMRQLERLAQEPISAVRRELGKLTGSELLISSREGPLKYYRVNKKHPIFEELKAIIFKTQGLGDFLKTLMGTSPEITAAFIFGSVANGGDNIKSDIDLMVIGSIDSVKLHEKIQQAERAIKRNIEYILIDEEEFRLKKNDFTKRVMKGKKIFLIGNELTLRRIRKRRQDQ